MYRPKPPEPLGRYFRLFRSSVGDVFLHTFSLVEEEGSGRARPHVCITTRLFCDYRKPAARGIVAVLARRSEPGGVVLGRLRSPARLGSLVRRACGSRRGPGAGKEVEQLLRVLLR